MSKLPQKFCYHGNVATHFFFLNSAVNPPPPTPNRNALVFLKFAPVEVQKFFPTRNCPTSPHPASLISRTFSSFPGLRAVHISCFPRDSVQFLPCSSERGEQSVLLTICFIDMAGYQENFVSVVDEDFQCCICTFPLREPLQTRCGHRFCRECLEDASTRFENFKFKLITHLTFDSEYQALLFLSFLECVFLQCFLVLKIQNGESEIYFLININVRYFSLFKAGVTRVSVNVVWVLGGVNRSFIASIHPHFSIFFNTPVRTHVLLNYEFFFICEKIIFYH